MPWLDYFDMLNTYERNGYLELNAEKHEAYMTQPALHAMTEGDDPKMQMGKDIWKTARRIRTYAGWKSQEGTAYADLPFAVNVVKHELPHDLLYTLLMERRRKWWSLWFKVECIEVIDYRARP